MEATWSTPNPNEQQLRFRFLCANQCDDEFAVTSASPAHIEQDLEFEHGRLWLWVGVDYAMVAGGFAGTGTEVTGIVRLTQNVTAALEE